MTSIDKLRREIDLRMGRECGVSLEDCLACQRKLRYMEAALAALDVIDVARAARPGVLDEEFDEALEKFDALLEKL